MVTTVRASLDRVVDGDHAVLLVESVDGIVDEVVLDVEQIPKDGRHDGAIFEITIASSELQDLTYLPGETRSRRADAQDRLDRLSSSLDDVSKSED